MAVLPSISQEANKFILARTMYGEIPCAFIVLVFLLTNDRSNSMEPLNMSRVWIPVRTRSKSFWEDPSDMLGPFHPYQWMVFMTRGTHVPQMRVGFTTHQVPCPSGYLKEHLSMSFCSTSSTKASDLLIT